jgi:hypothetical protein
VPALAPPVVLVPALAPPVVLVPALAPPVVLVPALAPPVVFAVEPPVVALPAVGAAPPLPAVPTVPAVPGLPAALNGASPSELLHAATMGTSARANETVVTILSIERVSPDSAFGRAAKFEGESSRGGARSYLQVRSI